MTDPIHQPSGLDAALRLPAQAVRQRLERARLDEDQQRPHRIRETHSRVLSGNMRLCNDRLNFSNLSSRISENEKFTMNKMPTINPFTALGRLLRPLLRRVQGSRGGVLGTDVSERAQPRPTVRRRVQLHGVEPGSHDHGCVIHMCRVIIRYSNATAI